MAFVRKPLVLVTSLCKRLEKIDKETALIERRFCIWSLAIA
ncbi:hypothetical protein [Vibrio gallaecicus]|nr:hypothetical protein [Vibrio gallaecicus]MDN3614104.1 hypothetical protein [Vibrio gallaecicus]